MQHTITKNISLGYNLGVEFDGTSANHVFIYTFAPSINIGESGMHILKLLEFYLRLQNTV
jgi:hypothetical protein